MATYDQCVVIGGTQMARVAIDDVLPHGALHERAKPIPHPLAMPWWAKLPEGTKC